MKRTEKTTAKHLSSSASSLHFLQRKAFVLPLCLGRWRGLSFVLLLAVLWLVGIHGGAKYMTTVSPQPNVVSPEVVGTYFMHVRLVPTVATFAALPFLAFVRTCIKQVPTAATFAALPFLAFVRTCIKQVPTAATFAAPPFLAFVRTCCRDLLYACPLSPYSRNVNAFANA